MPTIKKSEFWEAAFLDKQLMWGLAAAPTALVAAEEFARAGVAEVLIPGIGYGRNAQPFLARGMAVTGIEISETAVALARSRLGLQVPIFCGSVAEMPFDDKVYGGIFSYGLIYLLDAAGRAKFIEDCWRQLAPGGRLIVTAISKQAPMYGQGACLGEDWYERLPGLPMYFYDEDSIRREFGLYGLVSCTVLDEATPHGGTLPFWYIACQKDGAPQT